MPPATKSKYDPFFNRSMEYSPIAQAFFQQHLPAHIRPAVDFDTLVRVDRTNISLHNVASSRLWTW